MATAMPATIAQRSPGASVRGAAMAARRSQPADPAVAYAGRSSPSPWGRTAMGTVMSGIGGRVMQPRPGHGLSVISYQLSVLSERAGEVQGRDGELAHVADDREREDPPV